MSLDDIVVFGDGVNDISMFKYAKNLIAMGNSCDEIKSLAKGLMKMELNMHADIWDIIKLEYISYDSLSFANIL